MTHVVIGGAASREHYERVVSALDIENNRPQGLILHAASETGDGVQVLNVWESREAADDFERTRLLPAFESSGVMNEVPNPPPPPQHLDPFDEWIRGS